MELKIPPEFRELLDAWGPPEELDPELTAHIDYDTSLGAILKHPLVFSIPYIDRMAGFHNRQLKFKQGMLAEAHDKGDWGLIIDLHERPWRLQAFQSVMDKMTDAQYWRILRSTWVDSENIREFPDEWAELLESPRGERQAMMHDDEREALAAMSDRFTVWQGHTTERDDGWSWTTKQSTAVWFANRFASMEGDEPVVTRGTVRREDVLAYVTSRGEFEIIVNPELVVYRYVGSI